ncbi:MAG: exodeoxyribonuclease VII small subunit [Ruminococcaceae bacterium]|nr:exodeoxyribonuclease VII small subunit [Oscillospiraceae bacterium]
MNEMSYEQAVKRLDEIVSLLEKNEIELDEALALFEEGTKLTAFCTKKLSEAKQKITELEKE